MKHRLLFIISLSIIGSNISFAQSSRISFYFSAHPDDWQLFMGVNAFKDIAAASTGNSNKVVFIYTTAGEANCNSLGVNKGYYLARQESANRSIQFCSDIYSPHSAWKSSVISMQGVTSHDILQLSYKNIVCYFLRLPDGCEEWVPATITKLANRDITSLMTVDSNTTYHGYDDIVETVKNLVDYESSTLQQPEVWIQASDWDPLISPADHPDHTQTGRLATEIASRVGYASLALFEDYNTCNKPCNLTPGEIAMEASLQSQVSFGRTHSGWLPEWDPENNCGHVSWATRNYFRIYSTATDTKIPTTFLTISPNPAGEAFNINYKVMEDGPVNIALYDLTGNLKATILNEYQNRGVYTINYHSGTFPDGNYIICAKISGHMNTLKFTKL